MAGTVQLVVPDGIDDPLRPSGGNRYDRRICDGLRAAGWRVHERALPGGWPAAPGPPQPAGGPGVGGWGVGGV
jgi:hypothetical protein